MKRIIFLLIAALYLTDSVTSQFTVLFNDKPIKQGDEVQLSSSQTLVIGFANPSKPPEYTVGRASLNVSLEHTNGTKICQWAFQVDGYSAVESFLYPTQSKMYTAWFNDGNTEMTSKYGWRNMNNIYQELLGEANSQKVIVTVNLTYEESLGYDKYGPQIALLEKFSFTANVHGNDNKIKMEGLELFYQPTIGGEFEKMQYEKTAAFMGIKDEGSYKVKFKSFTADLGVLTVSNSQDEAMLNIKKNFENYVNYNANTCNGKKYQKNTFPPDGTINWSNLTFLSEYSVVADLDQKNNPSYASIKLLENFTVSNLTGYKYKGLRHSNECGNTESRLLKGANIFYILKHPGNNNKLLVFNYAVMSDKMTINDLLPIESEMEKFITGLSAN